jgi:hypothetical protein
MVFAYRIPCSSRWLHQATSPDGSQYAVVELFSCKDDASSSRIRVVIQPTRVKSDTPRPIVFSARPTTTQTIELTWQSNHDLLVEYGKLQPEFRERRSGNITIDYRRH